MNSILLFDLVFNMHLMKNILRITNDFSQVLQRKYYDILNAMNLVNFCKGRLQVMRESSRDSLLERVSNFCNSHDLKFLKWMLYF